MIQLLSLEGTTDTNPLLPVPGQTSLVHVKGRSRSKGKSCNNGCIVNKKSVTVHGKTHLNAYSLNG